MLSLFLAFVGCVFSQTGPIAPYEAWYDINDCSTQPVAISDFMGLSSMCLTDGGVGAVEFGCSSPSKIYDQWASFGDCGVAPADVHNETLLAVCSFVDGSTYFDETCVEPTHTVATYATMMTYVRNDCTMDVPGLEYSKLLKVVPSQCFSYKSDFAKVTCTHDRPDLLRLETFSDAGCTTLLNTQSHDGTTTCLPLKNDGGTEDYIDVTYCPGPGQYGYSTWYGNADATCSNDANVAFIQDFTVDMVGGQCVELDGTGWGVQFTIDASYMHYDIYPEDTSCQVGTHRMVDELYNDVCTTMGGDWAIRDHGDAFPSVTVADFAEFDMWDNQTTCTSGSLASERAVKGHMLPFTCIQTGLAYLYLECSNDGNGDGTLKEFSTADCSGVEDRSSPLIPGDGATCVKLWATEENYILGYDCPHPMCEGGEYVGTLNACGGHGSCTMTDPTCVCNGNWEDQGTGICNDFKCEDGTEFSIAGSPCSGHGDCTEPDPTCVCVDNWENQGAGFCNDFRCADGLFMTADGACGHGSCTATDAVCVCETNFDPATNCSACLDNWENQGAGFCNDFRCADGLFMTADGACGHGSCTATDAVCVCDTNFDPATKCSACLTDYELKNDACSKAGLSGLAAIIVPAVVAPVVVIILALIVAGIVVAICCFMKGGGKGAAPTPAPVAVEMDDPKPDTPTKQPEDDHKSSSSSSSDSSD